MTYGIVLAFDGVSEADYWAVNDGVGIPRDFSSNTPAGLMSHTGGATATGWVVTEVWRSKADQERWMADRLGAVLAEKGIPAPSLVIESDIVSYQTPK